MSDVPWRQARPVPPRTDILNGTATANGATIITVPAGRTWKGFVSLSASLVTAPAGIAGVATPTLSVTGAGAMPSGVIHGLMLNTPASTPTTAGSTVADSETVPAVIVAPANNVVTLTLQTGGATAARGTAIGELV